MSEQLKNKKAAIIRALDIRLIQVEFASCFKKIKPVFIANLNKEILSHVRSLKLQYFDLPLTPWFYLDPVSMFRGEPNNRSWLVFEPSKLKKALQCSDVLQIQEPYFFYSLQVSQLANKLNKPLIMAPWTCFIHPSTFIPPFAFNVRKVISRTDLFIARSKKAENDYLSYFKVPESKKVLIYHGVNLKRFFPGRNKKDGVVRILFAGHLSAHKGLDDILDIYPDLVKRSRKKVELVVCGGEGPLKQKVINMSKGLPISYLGRLPSLKMPEIYRSADIFCGPSKDSRILGIKLTEEGFGFVFLEAMASGLPVVTNRCGGIPELVGDDNMMNKQGDKEGLFKALYTLVNDEKMRQEIGKKNRIRTERLFDLNKQVIKEEKVILKRFF